MLYIVIAILCTWVGFVFGKKYQDFMDLLLARRVAKLIEQRDSIQKDREQFERWEEQDKRIARFRSVKNDD
jgi:hypothetical protein